MKKHAIFDPESRYSQMRAAFGEREPTFLGYLSWLRDEPESSREVAAPSVRIAADSPSTLVLGLGRDQEGMGTVERYDRAVVTPPRGELIHRFELEVEGLPGNVPCRALLIDPRSIEQLSRTDLGFASCGDDQLLEQVFDHRRLERNFHLARILSALPAQDERANPKGVLRFDVGELETVPRLPRETWVVVVFDATHPGD